MNWLVFSRYISIGWYLVDTYEDFVGFNDMQILSVKCLCFFINSHYFCHRGIAKNVLDHYEKKMLLAMTMSFVWFPEVGTGRGLQKREQQTSYIVNPVCFSYSSCNFSSCSSRCRKIGNVLQSQANLKILMSSHQLITN